MPTLLLSLSASLFLAQSPAAPQTPAPAPAQPAPAAAPLVDPVPLDNILRTSINDRTIATTLGAYITAIELSKAVEVKLPDHAASVQSRREEFAGTLGPGADALFALLSQRSGQPREKAEAAVRASVKGGLEKLVSELTPETASAMLEQGRLEPKNAQASLVSTLLSFSPGQMSDSVWLWNNSWKRTDSIELPVAKDKPAKTLNVSFPMSWGRTKAKPGESTWGENAGAGPVILTVNTRQLAGEVDVVKSVTAAATGISGSPVTAEPGTLAGQPSGQASFYLTKQVGEGTYRAKSRMAAVSVDGALVIVTLNVVGSSKAGMRPYSDAELDAYAQKRDELMKLVLSGLTITDGKPPERAPDHAP